MKKLVLTGVLSVGTLLGANLPGLEVITASAAIPSSLSIAEGNSQQTLFEQQREKYTGIVTGKTNQGLTIFTENVPANVLTNINIGDSVDIYSSYSSKGAENKAEDFIIGTVIDSDSDYGYATVEYKSNEGKTEIVDVIFTEAHSYKAGDKVKVTNKSKWEHKKIGPNNAMFASGDSISKVAEKEGEDFIIGSITESDSDYVIVEYKSNEGKTENVDVLLPKGHFFKVGDKVKVTNKEKWEHKKIGLHHVKFASENSIFKVTKNDSEDPISKGAEKEAEDFIIGTVIDSDSDYGYATVEYKSNEGKTETVDVLFTEAHSYKAGDKVKVTNKSKWEHKKIGPNNAMFASGDSISKVAEKEGEDFIIGSITESDSDYVIVEYKSNEEKTENVDVLLPKGHFFKVGDKVKVTNKEKWEHKKIGLHHVKFASENSIFKVTENE
ncbi:hypothetical protein [Brevibacillus laterosporus]|uniref:hypothetical protein n=1 Tax=Brevibacillus laterosporus TaxID=1465 RepID=UPI0003B203AD|nr:hypothetical protein [Brevibacillus laterosporus]ERM16664.1 hypothetical protein P615_22710 [Brevibacillus laterosporus PE36]